MFECWVHKGDNQCCSIILRLDHQMPYWGISLSCWGKLIGVVMHGRMVCINYLLHMRIICYTGAYSWLWWVGQLCALYLWFSILHRGLMSLWSVFAFVATLSPYMSTFFSFIIFDIVIGYIRHCLRLRWTPLDFTQKVSMDFLVKSLWDDLFSP